MILTGFALICAIFVASAAFAGNAGTFVNADSVVVVILGCGLYSVFLADPAAVARGLASAASFGRRGAEPDEAVADAYLGLAIAAPAVGLVSAAQGLTSAALGRLAIPPTDALCYASFALIYGICLSAFLFLPVYFKNR